MNTSVATQEKQSPAEVIKTKLRSPGMAEEWRKALPAHVPVERFQRIVVTAVATNPDLLRCPPEALFAEFMLCAQDGLLPDGREATILVYGTEPSYSPMVAGICKKARNSGVIKEMNAHVVCEKDEYDFWADETGEHFKFRKFRGGDRGKDILTFAFATTTDGGFYFEEVDEEQMAAIERCSKAKYGPWKNDFRGEMKRKSAIRRLAKYRLPSSTDLDQVIRRDDHLYEFKQSPTALPLASAPDYLPGVKPAVTAEQFVAKLKDLPQGRQLILNQIQIFIDQKDMASAKKLQAAAVAAGMDRVVQIDGPEEVDSDSAVPPEELLPFEKGGSDGVR